MKYDVIIIGSGLGGLECACTLSKKGMSVLVLERQYTAGGCMQSYKRHNVSYDTGLHYVGGLDDGQPLHEAFRELGLLELPWQRLDPEAFDKVTFLDRNQTYEFAEGYHNFVEKLAFHFPNERKALQEYVDMLRKSDEHQVKALINTNKQDLALSNWLYTTNAYDWLHEKFGNEMLVNVISGTSLKMELHKSTLPLFSFAHNNSGFIQSSWRLKGDGSMLVNKLIDTLKKNGGEIRYRKDVIELVENNGRITSAICSDGERFEADTFISDAHPSAVCSWVKNSTLIKNIYRRRMLRLENTFGMFTVSIRTKAGSFPYLNHNKYIYKHPNVWEFSENDCKNRGVLVSFPTSGNQIDILTPMLWSECQLWENTIVGRRGADYEEFKLKKAEECITIAETQLPGLRNAIEEMYTSSPLTYRDYNLTPNGSAYGIRKDCNMPLMTILTPRTPIPNLLMTGQNLMLHGLHGVTMTAILTCKLLIE